VTEAFCQLLDGTRGDLLHPKPEWFEVRALAHSLSSKYRWGGQSIGRITVAQHCVIVSRALGEDATLSFCGLMHEMDEHLLPEVVSPLKRTPQMAWFRDLCELHMATGCQWYGLSYPWPSEVQEAVKHADLAVCEAEARDLTADREWRRCGVPPIEERIRPLSPDVAEQEFLGRYSYLQALRRGGSAA
jgi:5'-nucleotidase